HVNSFAFEYADKKRDWFLKQFPTSNDFNAKFNVDESVLKEFMNYVQMKKDNGDFKSSLNYLKGIDNLLKALIGRNLFDKDSYYPILNNNDNCVLKALDVLSKEKK
ncbi:MAG: hypothetical protein JNM96_08070, partial [Bacteroidia bacterium]|nr:hypothetical protein [Bacteroidia bacterium]